jgi:hypothetical protein
VIEEDTNRFKYVVTNDEDHIDGKILCYIFVFVQYFEELHKRYEKIIGETKRDNFNIRNGETIAR